MHSSNGASGWPSRLTILLYTLLIVHLKQNLSPGSTSSSSLMVDVSRLTPVVAGVCDSTPRSLFSSESWGMRPGGRGGGGMRKARGTRVRVRVG